MICHRCCGLNVQEYLPGSGEWLWRCLNCGERVDRDILRNRAEQEAFASQLRQAQDRDIKEWSRWFAVSRQ